MPLTDNQRAVIQQLVERWEGLPEWKIAGMVRNITEMFLDINHGGWGHTNGNLMRHNLRKYGYPKDLPEDQLEALKLEFPDLGISEDPAMSFPEFGTGYHNGGKHKYVAENVMYIPYGPLLPRERRLWTQEELYGPSPMMVTIHLDDDGENSFFRTVSRETDLFTNTGRFYWHG